MANDSQKPQQPADNAAQNRAKPTPVAMPQWATVAIGIYLFLSFFAQIALLIEFWPTAETGKPPSGEFRIWPFGPGKISLDGRLIVIVLLAGGVGAMVHAVRSFTAHVGAHRLRRGWTWWYFMRPVEGAVMALAFYFVLRGGLIGTNASNLDAISAHGISAIAVLVGMFSQQAVAKLKEVAETLFTKPQDTGDTPGSAGTNPVPVLTSLSPASAKVGTAPPPTVTLAGSNFVRGSEGRVDGSARPTTFKSATELAISLTAEDLKTPGARKVVVHNPQPGGGDSSALEITVTAA